MVNGFLVNTNLCNTYEHTIDFERPSEQFNYFTTKCMCKSIFTNSKVDAFREFITVDLSIQEVYLYDYLILTDPINSKNYFYFIMNKEERTKTVTILHLELDLIQTYLFDVELMESFIDRAHVNRWDANGKPLQNTMDEGLEYGSTRILKKEQIKEIPLNYIICTTTPIGKLKETGGGGGDEIIPPTSDLWKNGIMSSNGFRFMKGYEGFGKYLYKDSGGVLTIGYGVTSSEPTEFNDLKSKQPVNEEYAAKISYKLKQKNYGKPILNTVMNKLKITKQCQFDALCDVAFNCGIGAINNIEKYSLPQAIMRDPNDEAYIRPIWENFIIKDANHVVQAGLVARRKAECDIYFKNKYEMRKIVIIESNGSYNGYVTENSGNGWLPPTQETTTEYMEVNNDYGTGWVVPVQGTVTAIFPNYSSGAYHGGTDIACPQGTPVRVSKDGTCIDRQELTGSFGKFLKIDHGKGLVTIYAHNSELLINKGDTVKKGQIIAKSGNTGNSTGAHCHWELRVDGVSRNVAPSFKVGQVIKY